MTPKAASIEVGSNTLVFCEKDVYRSKDLTLIRIESAPKSASEFSAWKNTFLTKAVCCHVWIHTLVLS